MLFAWKYFKASKWNHFNSQQIEFKSTYPAEGTEDALIRSDSFQIENSFVDNETLINDGCNDDDVVNHASDDNGGGAIKRAKKKFLKHSNRCGKVCDQYSEKRYLTAFDDEQFDFTPQTTL